MIFLERKLSFWGTWTLTVKFSVKQNLSFYFQVEHTWWVTFWPCFTTLQLVLEEQTGSYSTHYALPCPWRAGLGSPFEVFHSIASESMNNVIKVKVECEKEWRSLVMANIVKGSSIVTSRWKQVTIGQRKQHLKKRERSEQWAFSL